MEETIDGAELPLYLKRKHERIERNEEFWNTHFADVKKLTLEIGCGHGHFLTAYAENHPQEFCLGLDIIKRRVDKATAKAEKRGLDHLKFIKAEAKEFLSALPADVTLQKLFILFPDPWPKKRHHKNRIIQKKVLTSLLSQMTPESRLYFRTDHTDYFTWSEEIIDAHPAWERTAEEWPFEAPSFFQDMMDSYQSLIAKPLVSK